MWNTLEKTWFMQIPKKFTHPCCYHKVETLKRSSLGILVLLTIKKERILLSTPNPPPTTKHFKTRKSYKNNLTINCSISVITIYVLHGLKYKDHFCNISSTSASLLKKLFKKVKKKFQRWEVLVERNGTDVCQLFIFNLVVYKSPCTLNRQTVKFLSEGDSGTPATSSSFFTTVEASSLISMSEDPNDFTSREWACGSHVSTCSNFWNNRLNKRLLKQLEDYWLVQVKYNIGSTHREKSKITMH